MTSKTMSHNVSPSANNNPLPTNELALLSVLRSKVVRSMRLFTVSLVLLSLTWANAQTVSETACSESDKKAVEELSRRFFSEFLRADSLDSVRDQFLSSQCQSVFPLADEDLDFEITDDLRSQLDCNSVKQLGDSFFEFAFRMGEHIWSSSNVNETTDAWNLVPKEIEDAIAAKPRLSRVLKESGSGKLRISSAEEFRALRQEILEITLLLREHMRSHPVDDESIKSHIEIMKQENGVKDGAYPTRCSVSDDEHYYGAPKGTPVVFSSLYPFYFIFVRENGAFKITRIGALSQ